MKNRPRRMVRWIQPRLPTDVTSRYPLSIFPIPATGTAILQKNCGTGIIFSRAMIGMKKHYAMIGMKKHYKPDLMRGATTTHWWICGFGQDFPGMPLAATSSPRFEAWRTRIILSQNGHATRIFSRAERLNNQLQEDPKPTRPPSSSDARPRHPFPRFRPRLVLAPFPRRPPTLHFPPRPSSPASGTDSV